MVLDDELLRIAKSASESLRAAERKAEMAKADYHYAVRQLHLAGAPLREVAQALGISHQRVQQIVQAGGGTWWSRVWKSRKPKPDMACSFCGLPPSALAKLIAGPEVYICDACVGVAEEVLRTRKPEAPKRGGHGDARFELLARTSRARCSFCGKRSSDDGGGRELVGHGAHHACDACLGLCRGILDDRASAPPEA